MPLQAVRVALGAVAVATSVGSFSVGTLRKNRPAHSTAGNMLDHHLRGAENPCQPNNGTLRGQVTR